MLLLSPIATTSSPQILSLDHSPHGPMTYSSTPGLSRLDESGTSSAIFICLGERTSLNFVSSNFRFVKFLTINMFHF